MYIGEIAKLTGATPKAIRHYEALGLLGDVKRAGVYRIYSAHELRQVKLIKQAQSMGFRLSELRPVLEGQAKEPNWLQLCRQIEQKRISIQKEIVRLGAIDMHLHQIQDEIHSCLGLSRLGELDAERCDALLDTSLDAIRHQNFS
ncbi:MAG: MerR family transcriptional regulator [Glaciimonas sp.]|nr:MerR family transcriptional regulator [Glaciimonas sp.]